MMSTEPETRRYEPAAGEQVRESIRSAQALAATSGRPVSFSHNGRELTVQSGDSFADAVARWNAAHADSTGSVIEADDDAQRRRDIDTAESIRLDLERKQLEAVTAMREGSHPTEQEMREAKVPWPESTEDLSAYITGLVDRPHDYGTCVYAMSMAAVAAFNLVANKLGVTGFQASCADLDILRRTRGFEWGKLLNYENLLYPQYFDEDHFPSAEKIIRDNAAEFAKRARARLAEGGRAHPNVEAHWRWLASLAPAEPLAEAPV